MKDNINWLSDGEVEYVPKKIYRFVPRLSNGRQTDEITTINLPLIVRRFKIMSVKTC